MAQLFETPRQYISHVFAHNIPLSMQFLRLEDDRCRLSPLYTKDLCFFKEIGTNDCMLPQGTCVNINNNVLSAKLMFETMTKNICKQEMERHSKQHFRKVLEEMSPLDKSSSEKFHTSPKKKKKADGLEAGSWTETCFTPFIEALELATTKTDKRTVRTFQRRLETLYQLKCFMLKCKH